MGTAAENHSPGHICVGLLAHVDSGKTTLSESILYLSGRIRKPGRVDHGDTFLDTYALEKNRGITIFSKQAVFRLGETDVTLLDTPGHVDFSAEMERTLQILDYAVLIVNGADGVQGHTRTLWNLLQQYRIPVFLFVNKMDQEGTDRGALLDQLQRELDGGCIDFGDFESDELKENVAVCDESALEEYLNSGTVGAETIAALIAQRRVFPCFFGSALKMQGVKELLDGLERFGIPRSREEGAPFGAKVYKISRDAQGNRLTHMRVMSGILKVKDVLGNAKSAQDHREEKVNQIRIYSGEKFEAVQEAKAGVVCAVTGLNDTYPGEGLGVEKDSGAPVLEPVLNYRIQLPDGCDAHTMLQNLRQLEEEDPMLRIVWREESGEIHAQLMGEVQIEILQSLIRERFGVSVTFDTGSIVYKETICTEAEGVGHYEPLRHYAEVHLLLKPGKRGSGLTFGTCCSEDMLDRNWQRLVLTHLAEKVHRGVLTGAAITDMQILLTAGRAHIKHTEGGDFRQATYRAVRQGLMSARSVLLEPYYQFRLEVPSGTVGRALTDVQRMYGKCGTPEIRRGMSVLTGSAPVAAMRDYQREVAVYTRGQGRLFCSFGGYAPCHNEKEVIEACGYDPERDTDNPAGSIFCSHGAGVYIPWDQAPEHMHVQSRLKPGSAGAEASGEGAFRKRQTSAAKRTEEKELEEIFIRTYGKIERKPDVSAKTVRADAARPGREKTLREYLLVDGYNMIFSWDELRELAEVNIEAARARLMDILCNYQGFRKCAVILVFDAYRVEGCTMEIQKYHNIHVVYTKEAETADQYIEKVVHEIGRKYHVTVATSDGVEQVVTLGQGGTLMSATEFQEEMEIVRRQIREECGRQRGRRRRNYLFDHMDREMAREMEEVRLGRRELPKEPEKEEGD